MSENVEKELSTHVGQPIAVETPSPVEPSELVGTPSAPSETHSELETPAASDQAQDKEAAALQTLYRQAVHLTEPPPLYEPDGPINRMTHHELRAMRAKTGVETEVKVPFKETVSNFVIRSFDEFRQTFKKAGSPRRLKCLDVGHECIHCGKQFAIEKKAEKEK